MRYAILSIALCGLVISTAPGVQASTITFDLNSADTALQGTSPPYATVSVSIQGSTATFNVVADGPYSLGEVVFQTDPTIIFFSTSIPTFTGGVTFGDFPVNAVTVGDLKGGAVLTTDDQFGMYSFGVRALFGTVQSVSFTLQGPIVAGQPSVLRPNANGFLAAAQIYNGTQVGFAAGNGGPTVVTAAPEPSPGWLMAIASAAIFLLSRRRQCKAIVRRSLGGQRGWWLFQRRGQLRHRELRGQPSCP